MVRAGVVSMLAFAAAYSAAFGLASSSTAALSNRDYAVFSAFLMGQVHSKISSDDLRVGVPGSVLAPSTLQWNSPMPLDERKSMKESLRGLEEDTLNAFEACSMTSRPFEAKLSVSSAYHIASPEQIASIENLLTAFPKTWGYIRFSCIGFNPSEEQALFFVEREMCRDAVGKVILMQKQPSGEWLVKSQMIKWIS